MKRIVLGVTLLVMLLPFDAAVRSRALLLITRPDACRW